MRRRLLLEGRVQGVGFRPFVHSLAVRHGLGGHVRNGPPGVVIEVEGSPRRVDAFREELLASPPPGASVERVEEDRLALRGSRGFEVLASQDGRAGHPSIPPDLAPCAACLAELRDPDDRRYGYPFLNCTHCGPRFTIVRDVPYDRARTTLRDFPLCGDCEREYRDPSDRRFHAQAIACPACGPHLALEATPAGRGLAPEPGEAPWGGAASRGGSPPSEETGAPEQEAPLEGAARALERGGIVAVKGLGGFHLACDATDRRAVRRLRRRKGRDAKPFALMVPSVEAAGELCRLRPEDAETLRSPRRPILLLPRRADAPVALEVAPGLDRLGVMLPYTPLHELLLEAVGRPLVLTSGNRSGEPLAHRDGDARSRLGEVAELLLLHDRPIERPCDDSVLLAAPGGPVPLRRSRGFAPEPVLLPHPLPEPVLALGGHLKNTFALASGRRVVLSPHVGDLDEVSTVESLTAGLAHLSHLTATVPEVVVHDLHPNYRTTRIAEEWERGSASATRLGVQHHHAHALSCLAEHGRLDAPALAVALDGSGYGADGAIWGGEFLVVGPDGWERPGHLDYRLLPGGEAAVREPWRMAAVHLEAAGGAGGEGGEGILPATPELPADHRETVLDMIRRGVGGPATSSVGRLFDAAAALLGIRSTAAFEGQAAMELEAAARPDEPGSYPARLVTRDGGWVWDPGPIVQEMAADRRRGRPVAESAGAFHNAVRDAVLAACRRMAEETGLRTVALTGGVFQNALLLEKTVSVLQEWGFEPLVHRTVPPNDGGLALGQAVAPSMGTELRGPGEASGAR